jgi:hypothetical protein
LLATGLAGLGLFFLLVDHERILQTVEGLWPALPFSHR